MFIMQVLPSRIFWPIETLDWLFCHYLASKLHKNIEGHVAQPSGSSGYVYCSLTVLCFIILFLSRFSLMYREQYIGYCS